uniref:LRRNT domain-containing protein n=1 Tax=Oryzias latipes TaxID=8090 RepID=A0A3P9LQV5_ORYLA
MRVSAVPVGAPAAPLLLLLCLLLPAASCPSSCLCASDLISCSGRGLSSPPAGLPYYASRLDLGHNALRGLSASWLPEPFRRLASLVLCKNAISQIQAGAFALTPHLLSLDLSSNHLTFLNTSVFAGLTELEELLLIGNRIAGIGPGSFSDLIGLRRLYLSSNRLTDFPIEIYEGPSGPRNLTHLDLSFNRLSTVPVQTVMSLSLRGGVYLQENPLLCDCALLALLQYWMWKQYRPLVDFREGYPCRGADSVHMEIQLLFETRVARLCPSFSAQKSSENCQTQQKTAHPSMTMDGGGGCCSFYSRTSSDKYSSVSGKYMDFIRKSPHNSLRALLCSVANTAPLSVLTDPV